MQKSILFALVVNCWTILLYDKREGKYALLFAMLFGLAVAYARKKKGKKLNEILLYEGENT